LNIPRHLGGHEYKTHVDGGTPQYLIDTLNIKSFVDIGCGVGDMVALAKSKDLVCFGIDGDYSVKGIWKSKNIIGICNDYSKIGLDIGKMDLGWSVEFLEHVDECYLSNIFTSYKNCKYMCITHALPNKSGHHHVNCRDERYWVDTFKANGFTYSEELSQGIRKNSTMVREFIRETGKVFINEN
jgi:SAM-dependent methyltransferase